MPNGVDKNLVRLAAAAAVYRARFNAWPTHARFESIVLWDLARILDSENFAGLSSLLELRTQEVGISVGGAPGVQRYDDIDWSQAPNDAVDAARRWLAVSIRPELDHH